MNNIKNQSLEAYWDIGVHKNCAVTKVEVQDGVAGLFMRTGHFTKKR